MFHGYEIVWHGLLIDDKPNSPYFPENCTSLPPNERWKLLQLAIEDIVNNHIDINFPSPTTEDDDACVCQGVNQLGFTVHGIC